MNILGFLTVTYAIKYIVLSYNCICLKNGNIGFFLTKNVFCFLYINVCYVSYKLLIFGVGKCY